MVFDSHPFHWRGDLRARKALFPAIPDRGITDTLNGGDGDAPRASRHPHSSPCRAFPDASFVDELGVRIDAIGLFHGIECNPCRIENSRVFQLSEHTTA